MNKFVGNFFWLFTFGFVIMIEISEYTSVLPRGSKGYRKTHCQPNLNFRPKPNMQHSADRKMLNLQFFVNLQIFSCYLSFIFVLKISKKTGKPWKYLSLTEIETSYEQNLQTIFCKIYLKEKKIKQNWTRPENKSPLSY